MSFLKISDPVKRDEFVKDYLETRKRIRDSQLAERTGEIELQTGLSKFFKPITETQKASTKEITEGLKPIKEEIEKLPKELPQPALSILGELGDFREEKEEKEEEEELTILDSKYNTLLKEYGKDFDTTFGIERKGNNYYIGDKLVDFDGDVIWIGAKSYKSTGGLWELIASKDPAYSMFSSNDLRNYEQILRQTNVIFRKNNPNNPPKSSGGVKYKKFINPIWTIIKAEKKAEEKAEGKTGDGITIIPSDPNALLERLDLLMASKEAGNTGVRNELVSICDELKRQGIFNSRSYKNLMSLL